MSRQLDHTTTAATGSGPRVPTAVREVLPDWTRTAGKQIVRLGAMAAAGRRTTPTFMIIGAKRGGTTTLYRQIEQHPAYLPLVPSAARLPMRENAKGVHYFDTGYDRSERWYRSHFPLGSTCRRHAQRHGSAITGEASPYYLFRPGAAERAAATVPHALIIAVLRDPVERTISHWAEQRRNGIERLDLRAALDHEDQRVGDDGHLLATHRLERSFAHEHQSYAAQSEYAAGLDRWVELFGRDRMLLLYSEELYADPSGTLAAVTDFLGIDRPPVVDSIQRNAAPRPADIDADIRDRLIARFEPTAERVAGIVGRPPPWTWYAAATSNG